MSDVYKKIKDIYGDVYCEEFNGMPRYNDYEYAAEYVKSVYNALASTAYANERNDATECLKVGRYVLDEVLIRTIFSNLYCDFNLMSQILSSNGIRRESFIYNVTDKKMIERFRKRMNSQRLDKLLPIKTENNFKWHFKIPTMNSAFKDALLVRRTNGTEVFDVSDTYADIFKALMYDTNEQVSNSEYSNDRRMIRSCRIWDFSETTVEQITDIYKTVSENKNLKCRFAQTMFLEKMFGLKLCSELIKKGLKSRELGKPATAAFYLTELGYTDLHRKIADVADNENYMIISDVITGYVYPLCQGCMSYILTDVMKHLDRLTDDKRLNAVQALEAVCFKNVGDEPRKIGCEISGVSYESLLETFRAVHFLPERSEGQSVSDYLTQSPRFAPRGLSDSNLFVWDFGFADLTYNSAINDYEPCAVDLEEYVTSNGRVIY